MLKEGFIHLRWFKFYLMEIGGEQQKRNCWISMKLWNSTLSLHLYDALMPKTRNKDDKPRPKVFSPESFHIKVKKAREERKSLLEEILLLGRVNNWGHMLKFPLQQACLPLVKIANFHLNVEDFLLYCKKSSHLPQQKKTYYAFST